MLSINRALAVVAAFALASCGGDAPPTPPTDSGANMSDHQREVLTQLSDGVILPTLRAFATDAATLETAATTYAADPSDANRASAQAAWRAAMLTWQQAELMQVGPAGMGGGECPVIGGMDLRDEVYSWNITSECRIDQETVDGSYGDADALATESVNVRGLDALEYLLFVEGAENACGALSPINETGSWAALGETEIRTRRALYAQHAATLIHREAVRLRDLWEPDAGNFRGAFVTAGLTGSQYPTAQTAFDDLSSAMLYLDTATRDMKLGEPVGLSGCLTTTCFESLEMPTARVDIPPIRENVRAFARLFLGETPGTDAAGWDDLLARAGFETLATQVTEAIDVALAALDALGQESLEAEWSANPAGVTAAYEALGALQRLFKVDVITALDIQPTSCASGDDD